MPPMPVLDHTGQPYRNGVSPNDRFSRDVLRGPESKFAVPQVLTFNSIIGSSFRNFLHGQYDEAMRFSREDALAMRNDAYVRALVDERKLAVASLKWHLEVDNPRDPYQKAVKDGLTQMYRAIPRQADLTWSGLEALWFGRAGDQFTWAFKDVELPALPSTATGGGLPTVSVAPRSDSTQKRKALMLTGHLPVEGDKIDYDYDGNPYVLITPLAASRLLTDPSADVRKLNEKGEWIRSDDIWPKIKAKHMDVGFTTIGGYALYLKGSWRERYRIHTHEALDASFFEPWKASSYHGVGIRSVIFWYWWLRQEFLSNVTDWCARTGLGIRLWYYESGNAQSKAAVSQAAKDQDDKVNILVPFTPGVDRPALQVEETSGTGADLLLRIVKHVEDYLERYIVGQSMSGGSDDMSSGFGDKGRADFAKNTKWQITKRDASKFGDTNTSDVLDVMKKWTYPEFADMPCKQVFEVDDPDVSKWSEGAKTFVDMGGEIVEDEARSRLGLSAPREGDKTIGGQEALQAKQATSGHVKAPDGMGNESGDGQSAPAQPSASDDAIAKMSAMLQTLQEELHRYAEFVTVGGHAEGGAKHVGGHVIPVSKLHEKSPDDMAKSLSKSADSTESSSKEEPSKSANLPISPEPTAQPQQQPDQEAFNKRWEGLYRKYGKMADQMAQRAKQRYPGMDFDFDSAAVDAIKDAAKADPASMGNEEAYVRSSIAKRLIPRKQGKSVRAGTLTTKEGEQVDVADRRGEGLMSQDDMEQLQPIIEKLDPQTKALWERMMAGHSNQQIAQDLGVSPPTATRMKQRLIEQIREGVGAGRFEELCEKYRYIFGETPDRYADGRSSEYRRHSGRSIEHAVERLKELAEQENEEDAVKEKVAGIAKQFSKTELREVAKEFGVRYGGSKGSIIQAIIDKLVEDKEEDDESANLRIPSDGTTLDSLSDKYARQRRELEAMRQEAESSLRELEDRYEAEQEQIRFDQEQARLEEERLRMEAEAEQERVRNEQEAKVRHEEAEREKAKVEAKLLADISNKLDHLKPEPVRYEKPAAPDLSAIIEAIRNMPPPVVNVTVPEQAPLDLSGLAGAIAKALVDAQGKKGSKSISIKKGTDGTYTAKVE